MKYLNKGEIPPRKHIGVIVDYISLDKACDYYNFPQKLHIQYASLDKEIKRKALVVQKIIVSTPSDNALLPGDILWKVNGNLLGADLYKLDMAMNQSKDSIELEIYRQGEKQIVKLGLYNINNKITELIDFAGAIFFSSDDYNSMIIIIPIGSLSIVNMKTGSFANYVGKSLKSKYTDYPMLPIAFGGEKISTLQDLKK